MVLTLEILEQILWSHHRQITFLATLLSHNTTLFLGVYEESKQIFMKCKVWYAVESERVYKRP